MADPENFTLHLLQEMRAEFGKLDAKIDGLGADLRSEMKSLRADVASDLLTLEKRVGEQIAGLRRAVVEYHSAVIGHGVLISELDERVTRLETAPSGAV